MDEDADLDSDVVDAIYAKMYFNAEENPQNQLKGLHARGRGFAWNKKKFIKW